MVLSWKSRRRAKNNEVSGDSANIEVTVPAHFRCPISLDLMKDPVTLATGITYDRPSIEKWIEEGNRKCPATNQMLPCFDQIPNHSLRKMIQAWCVENSSFGIERIPTPRIPVTPYDVSETCKRITEATQRGDRKKCQELVGKFKNWGKESDRNKRCVVENGAGCVLSACFESFASVSMENHADLLGDILSALTWMFPLGEEGQSKLGSVRSLSCMVWLFKSGDLSARQNAVLVLKELVSSDQKHANSLVEIEGVVPALVKLIKEPVNPIATKAALMVIFYMTSHPINTLKIISPFVEMGLVSLIIEILVDGDKSICEKALGVLDHICDSKIGREEAYENALVVPVLVKKIFRVSVLASEFSASILWKLCKNEKREAEGSVAVEALRVGGFQKLLVLLQVGCKESTKEKVKELLKVLNIHRVRLDCVDSSMDLKHLKRSH